MQQRAAWGHGNHGQRVRHVFGGQRGAFQGVQRDIHRRAFAGANLFADVEHRGLVTLAFADHHDTRDVEKVQLVAHGVDGGLIGGLFIAASNQFSRSQGRRLGHAGKAQRKKTVLKLRGVGHDRSFRYNRLTFSRACRGAARPMMLTLL